jgi:hypothetical protein
MASRNDSARGFLTSFSHGMRKNWQVNTLFVALVMAIAAIITAINGITDTKEQNRKLTETVRCQNSYNTINNTRTRLLSEANERESAAAAQVDTAFEALVRALGKKTDAEIETLVEQLANKLQARQEARNLTDQERLKNPVPPPPQALCGAP